MNSRDRFLKACAKETLDRPPIWVMRQAGRYLPEYRKLKQPNGFLKMVRTPELAMEVTMQPIRRFKFDAAILFSDILVIPEAMGQPYSFRDPSGIDLAFAIKSEKDVDSLITDGIPDNLKYVFDAIKLIKTELSGKHALIGFGGSPWTLATYMVEGGSSKNYANIKSMFYSRPDLFHKLLVKISDVLIEYFTLQIESGVDAIQIFDSWGGILSQYTYWDASAKYMAKIINALRGKVPFIVFSKGSHHWIKDIKRINADVVGLDWTISIAEFYDNLGGEFAVQGNLDPIIMNTSPNIVEQETLRILNEFGNRNGHIFNLGHGILPDAKIECMEMLVATVQGFKKSL